MTYTENADFYFALNEKGINRLIKYSMLYVPSFFNFGSSYISSHPEKACSGINADPNIIANGDPLISAINLPIPSNLQLPMNISLEKPNFIAQLSELQVDFSSGNVITLPGTLPPLPNQQLALHAKTFIGLSCPLNDEIKLDCFSVDMFAELALKYHSAKFLDMHLTAFDIVGIDPKGLRTILDCYIMDIANQALRYANNRINDGISRPITSPLEGVVSLEVSPTIMQNNPAIEDDQLKLFMNLVSIKLNEVIGPSGSSTPGSKLAPVVSHSARNRPGTGPGDLTIAISQKTISKALSSMLNGGIKFEIDSSQYGTSPLYINYQVSASLKSGTVRLQDDGRIQITDLLISWDTLKFTINIDLPKISTPGIHIPAVTVPNPLNPRGPPITIVPAVDIDGLTFFGEKPDISIPIDLSGNFVSQVSIGLEPVVFYGNGDPSNPKCPNRWQLYVVPQLPIFVLPLELSAKLTSKIKHEIDSFFKLVFLGLPDKVIDMAKDALSKLLPDPIKLILSDPVKFTESTVDTIVKQIGIANQLDKLLYDYLVNKAPIFELQDPFPVSFRNPAGPTSITQNPIGPADVNIPIPIAYLGVRINSSEMVMEGDIG